MFGRGASYARRRRVGGTRRSPVAECGERGTQAGRGDRGAAASACVLLYSTGESGRLAETARERLKAMAETNDGFEIARRDLDIRGPGELLGARQSGDSLLRFADLSVDTDLLSWAQDAAPKMLDQYPALSQRHVARWLGSKSDFLKA